MFCDNGTVWKVSEETLSSMYYMIKLFIFKLTTRKEKFLNPISNQVSINAENLEILVKLIYFCGVLLKNVLIHINGLMMGDWRRGECQGE